MHDTSYTWRLRGILDYIAKNERERIAKEGYFELEKYHNIRNWGQRMSFNIKIKKYIILI